MSTAPARLRVGIVGAGRVGAALGVALTRAGHQVIAVSAVSAQSLRRAERMLPGVPIRPADEIAAEADFVLLAVPDDALRPLITGLAAAGAWRPGQLVAHTSGAHGIGVLDAAAARGVLALALHPVMTFTGRAEDVDRISGSAFGVTADEQLRPVAEVLVVEMGGEPVWVPERARALYHAALTVGSNHLVTLVNDALSMLASAGVEQPAQLLAPLLSASLDNVLRLGDAALTGPVSRGDVATVATHLHTLATEVPDMLAPYVAMARRTAERARAAGQLTDAQAADVLRTLGGHVIVVNTRDELAAALAALPKPVGLVPTMGALHDGHEALVTAAAAECASVVVTIFVNPMQFGPSEDLARYPRTLQADLAVCERAGASVVWAPDVTQVYRTGTPQVTVQPGELGAELEGAVRPTHFAGMLTVVAKLLNIVHPDRAYFGEKDFQQLVLIRRMDADLDLGAAIIGVPTVREPDGLALSSRNRYLSAEQRVDALALSAALFAGRDAAAGGASAAVRAARAVLDAHPALAVDYLELRGPDLGPAPSTGSARLLVAARVGDTRLIDNVPVTL